MTDTGGLLLEVTVTPANVHDSVAAPELLDAFMAEPGRLLKLVWADTAYQGPALATRSPRMGSGSRSSSAPTESGDLWCSRAGGRLNARWAGFPGPGA
ncbi:transposase [Streptacidiphilus neutrinimicus]|uniref:transposase n=1 Tax=Streptacidiphilus neutrinimicus TaxID=105420 RepID=UPI003F71D8A3